MEASFGARFSGLDFAGDVFADSSLRVQSGLMLSQDDRDTAPSEAPAMTLARQQSSVGFHLVRARFGTFSPSPFTRVRVASFAEVARAMPLTSILSPSARGEADLIARRQIHGRLAQRRGSLLSFLRPRLRSRPCDWLRFCVSRLNVLIHSKEVIGVVFVFDGNQPLVIVAVRCFHTFFAFIAHQEIDVGSAS